jgi:hypothetical protein
MRIAASMAERGAIMEIHYVSVLGLLLIAAGWLL